VIIQHEKEFKQPTEKEEREQLSKDEIKERN